MKTFEEFIKEPSTNESVTDYLKSKFRKDKPTGTVSNTSPTLTDEVLGAINDEWDLDGATMLPYSIVSRTVRPDMMGNVYRISNGSINYKGRQLSVKDIIGDINSDVVDNLDDCFCIGFKKDDENKAIVAAVAKPREEGAGFNALRKKLGIRPKIGFEYESVLVDNAPWTASRFIDRFKNASIKDKVVIDMNGHSFVISSVDDDNKDGVAFYVEETIPSQFEGRHLNEVIQSLKTFPKNAPLSIECSGAFYRIASAEEFKGEIHIKPEVKACEWAGALETLDDNQPFEPENNVTQKPIVNWVNPSFDELTVGVQYYLATSGDKILLFNKDDNYATFVSEDGKKTYKFSKADVDKNIFAEAQQEQ